MTTNLYIILDKSGSMGNTERATLSGINEYLQTLAKDGNHYHVTLTLFDTVVTKLWKSRVLDKDLKLTPEQYSPGGMTALYDAVCSTLKNVSDEGKNLVVIMTDGFENSSKEYRRTDMKRIINDLQATDRWTFVYMGANQDAYAEAANYGIPTANSVTYNATNIGTRAVFAAAGLATTGWAGQSATASSNFYSAEVQAHVEQAK